jgi:hypothetical protein
VSHRCRYPLDVRTEPIWPLGRIPSAPSDQGRTDVESDPRATPPWPRPLERVGHFELALKGLGPGELEVLATPSGEL